MKRLFISLLELILGGFIIFPTMFIIGVIYTLFKHLIKLDYSISKQAIPVIRSITLAFDGLANAGSGEIINDILKVKEDAIIRYGKWYQTISSVTGLRQVFNNSDNWFRRLINRVLGKNHCIESITKQEFFYYSNHK